MASKATASTDAIDGLFVVGGKLRDVLVGGASDQLRDHLASLLQVHNLSILIGSGASVSLGAPLIRQVSNKDLADLAVKSGSALPKNLQTILEAINPDGVADLEDLLNTLQVIEAFLDRTGSASFDLHDVEVSLINLQELQKRINVAVAHACKLPTGDSSVSALASHREFLSRVSRSRRENLPRPRVFTTNYDLAIEKSLDQLGYAYIDGFSGTVERKMNLAFYGLDFHQIDSTSQSVLSRSTSSFFLHKLHGSLNWRASQHSSAIDSFEVLQVAEDAPIDDGLALIYPTSAKAGDTLAYPYVDMLRMLSAAVQQPDTALIVAGYGFSDAHINRILLGALAMNPSLHVLIADPFGLVEAKVDLQVLSKRPRGDIAVDEMDVKIRESPIAALAKLRDPRIAILSGPQGSFDHFASLLPTDGSETQAPDPGPLFDVFAQFGIDAKREAGE